MSKRLGAVISLATASFCALLGVVIVSATSSSAAPAAPPAPYSSGGTSAPGSTSPGSTSNIPHPGHLVVEPRNPKVGGTLHIEGNGASKNGKVNADLHTAVWHLGSGTANSHGHFNFSVRLPAGVTGQHTVVVTDAQSGVVLGSVLINIGGRGSGHGSTGGSGSGGVSATGVAVAGMGVVGLALIGGGAFMLMAGRRRRHA